MNGAFDLNLRKPTASGKVWIVGVWVDIRSARVARCGLIKALRRGLGVRRAIEVAQEVAADPRVIVVDGEDIPRRWSVRISRGGDGQWCLELLDERDCPKNKSEPRLALGETNEVSGLPKAAGGPGIDCLLQKAFQGV